MSESKIAAWPRPPGEDEIRGLLERARGGDATALDALRGAMGHYPEIWRSYGDLASHARDAWVGLIAGTDLALKESLGRQVEALKAELAGPDPSPVETLLVERIAACWLQIGHADVAVAQSGNVSIRQADHARKRQDSAHRRYLMAVATLATVRRLLPSPIPLPGEHRVSATGQEDSPAGVKSGRGDRGRSGREVTRIDAEGLLAFRRSGGEEDRGNDRDDHRDSPEAPI